jgi:hypothetical protein
MDTYPKKPNFIEETTSEHKTSIVSFERGNEQRAAQWSSGKKHFTLKHKNLNQPEKVLLENFFADREGMLKPFWFINHIDGNTYKCRFSDDKLEFSHNNAKSFNLTVRIQECKQ